MVEIFKTNVKNKKVAKQLLKMLHSQLPACCFNFDLDDCDRILRAQSENYSIEINCIIEIVREHSIEICLLED
jgi:hypothetical protein